MVQINNQAQYSDKYIKPQEPFIQSESNAMNLIAKKNLTILQHEISLYANQHGQSYLEVSKKMMQTKIEDLEGRTKGICNFLKYLFSFSLRLSDRSAKIQKAEALKKLVSHIDTIYNLVPKVSQKKEDPVPPLQIVAQQLPSPPASALPALAITQSSKSSSLPSILLSSRRLTPSSTKPANLPAPPPAPPSPSSTSATPPPPPPFVIVPMKRFAGQPESEYVLTQTSGEVSLAKEYIQAMQETLKPIKIALDKENEITQMLSEARKELKEANFFVPKFCTNLNALQGPEGHVDLLFSAGQGSHVVRFYSEAEFERLNQERSEFDARQMRLKDKIGLINEKFRKTNAIQFYEEAIVNAEQASQPIHEKINGLEAELRALQSQTNNEIPFNDYKKLYDLYEKSIAKCQRAVNNRENPRKLPSRTSAFSQTLPALPSSSQSEEPKPTGPADLIIDQTFEIALRGNADQFYTKIG